MSKLDPNALAAATVAMANEMAKRKGVPPLKNPLDLMSPAMRLSFMADAEAAVSAYLSALPVPGEVVAKTLEWRELTNPREDGPPEPTGDWEADSVAGYYHVYIFGDHYEVTRDNGDYVEPWCGDAIEAKAAAQADYEARISSALVQPLVPQAAATEAAKALDDLPRRLREWPGDGQALRDEAADDLEALHANTASLLEIIDVWKGKAEASEAKLAVVEPAAESFHERMVAAESRADTLQAEVDRLRGERDEALKWYGERASTLASRLNGMSLTDARPSDANTIEAILVELSLDAGRRAARSLLPTSNEGEPTT